MGLRNCISKAKMSLGIVRQHTSLNLLNICTHVPKFGLIPFLSLWCLVVINYVSYVLHKLSFFFEYALTRLAVSK